MVRVGFKILGCRLADISQTDTHVLLHAPDLQVCVCIYIYIHTYIHTYTSFPK